MTDLVIESGNELIWKLIQEEIKKEIEIEPMLASYLYSTILNHKTLEDALSFVLSTRLGSSVVDTLRMRELIDEAFSKKPELSLKIRADILAFYERDPACEGYATPLLFYKGYQALQAHRIANFLWKENRRTLAYFLQNRISEIYAVDIHPAATIGCGILLDHATSIVVGETAVIEDNVSILHEVTLGGTGKECGDRHPKIKAGVLIGAGAKILGNVIVGEGAKIGAGSVVLGDVPPHSTVAGVPARVVGEASHERPALEMDHRLNKSGNCSICHRETCVDCNSEEARETFS
jgi:serine O-acetyltransferase